jgi:hypothetical protein
MRTRRNAEGIPVDPTTWGEIVDCAVTLGLDRAAVAALAEASA